MTTITINRDKIKEFSTLDYISNNENDFFKEELEFCERKEADAKVVTKWKDNYNRRRQNTSYIRIVDMDCTI